MRHDDYVYQGEFEASDYWAEQRAESQRRLEAFREKRAPEIEARKKADAVRRIEQERERLEREREKIAQEREELSRIVEERDSQILLAQEREGVRHPISGVGPSFVIPWKHETVPRYIRRWVAFAHDVKVSDIDGPRRHRKLVKARQHVFYELRARTNLSSTQIGRICGKRDHTTVLHGIKKHAQDNGLPSLTGFGDGSGRADERGEGGIFIKGAINETEKKS